MFKQTFSFLGWNTFGTAAHAINDQGINILLNIFFGPTVNAARAVSFQVSANISNLVSNFFVSLRPQVVKSYVNEEHNYLKQIFIKSSKYSFFFLWLLCLPFIMNVNTILAIWLKKVPEDAPLFTIWVLIFALINNFTNPVWTIIIATGSLKKFMLIGNGIFLLVFPIGFLVLKMGYPPVSVFIVLCVIRFLFLIAVLKILQDHIEYSFIEYFKTVILPVVLVAAVTFFIAFQLKSLFSNSALSVLLYGFIIGISVFFITFLVGLNTTERLFVQNFIKRKLGVKFIGQLN